MRSHNDVQDPFSKPERDTSHPAGFGAPAMTQLAITRQERQAILELAADMLHDPLAMQMLCDRVYQLMQEDLHTQRERSRGYGRRY